MNWTDTITALLSNHRQAQNPAQPMALTRQQILSLLHYVMPPDMRSTDWQTPASQALEELHAQGEILAGTGKRYCMAPPTVLALSKEEVTSLRFQGDRAYLPLVHQVLKTAQPEQDTLLRSKVREFDRLQMGLQPIGVRLLTVLDSLEGLPEPRIPIVLRSPLGENPFVTHAAIEQYVPQLHKNQAERWQSRSSNSSRRLDSESLLKLPTGEYFWLCDGKFYELELEIAVLAMFAQDVKTGYPLRILWDEAQGRICLQGIILPGTYARWLWRLSDPDPDRYRTRLIPPNHRPFIKSAFARLNCQLV
jgi:hypothetical protein